VANDTKRFNNFDNLAYFQNRTPQGLLAELLKITKPAGIISMGPLPSGEIGHYAYVEILAKGRKSSPPTKVEKTKPTKTETMELDNG
jgi:hypothetical protein